MPVSVLELEHEPAVFRSPSRGPAGHGGLARARPLAAPTHADDPPNHSPPHRPLEDFVIEVGAHE